MDVAVVEEGKEQVFKNRWEHVQAVWSQPDYLGDIVWTDKETGKQHSTARGTTSIDAAGATHAYNNRYTGTQTAFVAFSDLTKKPLYLGHKQTGCGGCNHAMHEAIENGDDPSLAIGKHSGKCYHNSNLGPAVAEEHCAVEAANDFLLDSKGNYVGDDMAVYGHRVVSDGDTRASVKLIATQASILGDAATDDAEQDPNCSHLCKCMSNSYFLF